MVKQTTIMIVLLAIAMITVPIASAGVTEFSVTPTTTTCDTNSSYTIQLNTTGFDSLNITIPAGYAAVVPDAGNLLAEVDLWNETIGYYGYVNFTANATNSSTEIDVYADVSGSATFTQDIDYSEGASTVINSPLGSKPEMMNLTLPTASADGSLKLYGLPDELTNITLTIGPFVKNPAAGIYNFTAEGVKNATVTITATPTVSIESADVSNGADVVVPISITNASNIGAMDISVTYNASVLTATGVANGSMIEDLRMTYGSENVTVAHNISEAGIATINVSFATYPPVIDGTGVLFNVTFHADAVGNSTLDITVKEAWAADWIDTTPAPQPVTPIAVDGYVNVTETGLPKTGDMDGSGGLSNMQDVIYLARHVMISRTTYPLQADGDVDSSGGNSNMQDVIHLARHVMISRPTYPLYP